MAGVRKLILIGEIRELGNESAKHLCIPVISLKTDLPLKFLPVHEWIKGI